MAVLWIMHGYSNFLIIMFSRGPDMSCGRMKRWFQDCKGAKRHSTSEQALHAPRDGGNGNPDGLALWHRVAGPCDAYQGVSRIHEEVPGERNPISELSPVPILTPQASQWHRDLGDQRCARGPYSATAQANECELSSR